MKKNYLLPATLVLLLFFFNPAAAQTNLKKIFSPGLPFQEKS
jgi:hypothetical protein